MVTTKGKGYGPAELDKTTFHGVGVFDPETGEASKGARKTYTSVFGETAVEIGEQMPQVVAVTAAMTDNTGLKPFSKRFPERFFDVGMAEEHAVTFSAALAADGLIPLTAIYSTFLQRAFDQILHDVAVQGLSIVLVVDRAGLVGEDGAPQHGAFDLSLPAHGPRHDADGARERRGAARHDLDGGEAAAHGAGADRRALPARPDPRGGPAPAPARARSRPARPSSCAPAATSR